MGTINSGSKGIPLSEIINKLGNKNYDYVEIRCKWTETSTKSDKTFDHDELIGYCQYIDGKLTALDYDSYSLDDLYVEWEEWIDEEENNQQCLTVWEYGEFTPD